MPTPRQYAHFLAALEQRTLLGAAQVVNLSQPALSKSILALEQEYGVKLFDRYPRGLIPTPQGLALEHHARRILLDIEQSKHDLDAITSGATGRVRIGVGQTFVQTVEHALRVLENSIPGANYTVITDYAEGLRSALLENRVDLVIGMVNRLVADPEFETKVLASDPIVGLCHKSHGFAQRSVSLDQLRGQDWLVPERGEVARSALEAFFLLNHEPIPRFRVVTNIPALLGRYVRDFQFLSLSPMGSVSEYDAYDLTWFTIDDFHFDRQIGIVQRTGVTPNPLSIKLQDILETAIETTFGKTG